MSDTQNLPAEVDQATLDALMAQAGVDPNDGGDRVPRLRINYEDEDEQEQALPKGKFTITGLEGEQFFSDTASIRILTQHFQYSHYDAGANKMISQTTLVPRMSLEMPDDKGTTRCGMPAAKGKLSDDQKKKWKDVKIHRQIRCLVTMTGKTVSGEEVSVVDQPALLDLSGANFMVIEEEFVKKIPRGRKLLDYQINLTRTKEKTGATTYWVIHYEADFTQPLPITMEVVEVMQKFIDSVNGFNASIIEKHEKAVRARQGDSSAMDALGEEGDLDDDLEDEIPY